MATYGITPTGFVIKSYDDLESQIIASVQSAIGVLPTGAALIVIDLVVACFAELWELGQASYSGQDPDSSTGSALVALSAITGTDQEPATASTVTLSFTGTPTATVPSGSQAKVPISLITFTTAADATILAVAAWVGTTVYAIGDRRTNAGNVYACTIGGTSASSGGPSVTGTGITDGSVTWTCLGNGTGVVDSLGTCSVTGPTVALSGTITQIGTPVVGWTGVYNLLDATVGTNVETDAALRVRRAQEIALAGSTTQAALLASLLDPDTTPGVTSATVFVNDTDSTNSDSMPPHSVECLVNGGAIAAIAQTILDNRPAGTQTTGSTTTTATDSEGFVQTIKFSRPALVNIYNTLTVYVDASKFPADGATQIKTAISTTGNALSTGRDAVAAWVGAQCFAVAGVLDVPFASNFIGTAPSPSTSTTVAISTRQLAQYDSSRITLTITPVTP